MAEQMISMYDVEEWGKFIIRCDREELPILSFKDYQEHIRKFNE